MTEQGKLFVNTILNLHGI